MALLTRRPRPATVRAITPCTLLALDQQRFLRLLRRSRALQKAVREGAAKRGIKLDLEEALAAPASNALLPGENGGEADRAARSGTLRRRIGWPKSAPWRSERS